MFMNGRFVSALLCVCLVDCVTHVRADEPASLFRAQYHVADSSFCNVGACVDFDGDGRRELCFASRETGQLQMLRAADGRVIWSKSLAGDQQSLSAFDLDGDGTLEIVYTVSAPGRLYVLDPNGELLGQWESREWKLGNSPVVIDSDGDGRSEGFLGSRSDCLVQLDMNSLTSLARRDGWGGQCGCHTSAMDVDGDGRWDLFAGAGDDHGAKGVLHRYDPVTLESVWTYRTDDNASSADAVLVDINGDGGVEVIKSVDNYAGDDAHDAVYAFDVDGNVLWRASGISGEDSPNVADLDGDGEVEIVGMTFANEVYCLDSRGEVRWRCDLRPELGLDAHAYMAPILCDVNGDSTLEIVALTNGGYMTADDDRSEMPHGIVFAISPAGEILNRFDVGGPRYWGEAFMTNVDDDSQQELIATGQGGLDVIEAAGLGTSAEYYQRRRTYARLNVYPWRHEDSYFDRRGEKKDVVSRADSLVLAQRDGHFVGVGQFTTALLTLPPECRFSTLRLATDAPNGTDLVVDVLGARGDVLLSGLKDGVDIDVAEPVRLVFRFSTTDNILTPRLDSYSLEFQRLEAH